MHNPGRTIYLQVYFSLRKRGRRLLKPFHDENCRFMSSQKYYMIICTYHPFGEPSFIKLFIYISHHTRIHIYFSDIGFNIKRLKECFPITRGATL